MSVEVQEFSSVEVGSNRSFGLVFAAVFFIIGAYPLLGGGSVHTWALLVCGAFLLVTFTIPRILRPLNLLWFRFGLLLGRIVSPIVMFVIYVTTVLPIGLIMRLFGKDLLNLKLQEAEQSYWIERSPPGPEPESLEEQF